MVELKFTEDEVSKELLKAVKRGELKMEEIGGATAKVETRGIVPTTNEIVKTPDNFTFTETEEGLALSKNYEDMDDTLRLKLDPNFRRERKK